MLQTDFIPAQEKDSKHLMVVLHGLGDSMEGYRFLPQVLQLPWLNYLLVNAPDEYYDGYAWFPYPSNNMTPAVTRSRELLFELLDEQGERGFKSEETYMFGFSQGCMMAVEIGMRYPHKLAGIIGISGWAHEPDNLLADQAATAKDQKFLITHGTMDPMVPFSMAKDRFDQLKKGGLNIDWHSFPKEHTIHGEREITLIRNFVVAQRKP
jgi:phospholipase/carboxylesterase